MKQENKKALFEGMHSGIPIGLGYFAVSFSLGIAAKNAGISALEAFFASLMCNASAGEYAGFTIIAASAGLLQMAIVTLIVNARYMLMSCALSQKMSSDMKFWHRLLLGFYVTDEFFGIAIARPGKLNPFYSYGAVLVASPLWAIGTYLGTVAGNLLPLSLVSAFSVALYGMFLAIILPTARKDKKIAGIILVCFILSFIAQYWPLLDAVPDVTKTIILTVVISAAAALFFPRKEVAENE